jgi:pyrroline-5-carboxylate reductase
MGGAILRGYIAAGADPRDIAAFDKDVEKLAAVTGALGIAAAADVGALAAGADVIVLAVKPNHFEDVLPELAAVLTASQIVVSMAAGIRISFIEGFLGASGKIVRIMPNTPAMVGESMTAVSRNASVTEAEFAGVMEIFRSIGRAEAVDESLFDVVTGLSGSSPAYVYMFIDALTRGAAQEGMDAAQARVFAAQSVLGAARMVLETGTDPERLRLNVCSPGGTTIAAVEVLQRNGFEECVAAGMKAAVEKSRVLTR